MYEEHILQAAILVWDLSNLCFLSMAQKTRN